MNRFVMDVPKGILVLSTDESGKGQLVMHHKRGESYDADGLLQALISAEYYGHAAPELRDWHQARATALAKALGLDSDRAEGRATTGARNMLTHAIAEAAKYLAQPFSGYLECPKELHEIVRPYAAMISELQGKLYKQWHATARALLLRMHPHLANATTTSEALQELGFDDSNEPDEIDYF